MKISFVIPAHNEEKTIAACLKSISEQVFDPSYQVEILVVDNVSTDRTSEIAGSFPGVRVVYEANKGLTYARQRGLIEAKGDLLAYIDADTRPSGKWSSIVQKTFTKDSVVCLSGPYRYHDLFGVKKFFAELIWWITTPITYWLVGYMVLGGNFVARRSALEKMGGFDTNIRFYGEDTNIAWRLAKIGKVVWRMNFFVYSSGRRLIEEGLIRSYLNYGINYLWGALFHRPFTNDYRDIR
jgi:glycosyltransferase involved in cell wall biosynthesis